MHPFMTDIVDFRGQMFVDHDSLVMSLTHLEHVLDGHGNLAFPRRVDCGRSVGNHDWPFLDAFVATKVGLQSRKKAIQCSLLPRIKRQGIFGPLSLHAMVPQPVVVSNDCLPILVGQASTAGANRRLGQACDDFPKRQLPLGDLLVPLVDAALLVVRTPGQPYESGSS